jgi:hypothetical protein
MGIFGELEDILDILFEGETSSQRRERERRERQEMRNVERRIEEQARERRRLERLLRQSHETDRLYRRAMGLSEVVKAEILEIDKEPLGVSLQETGLVRVGRNYYLIEIHESLFEGRRTAKCFRARSDATKLSFGPIKEIRCGSVKKAFRALVAEL